MRFEETDVVIVGGSVAGLAMAAEAFRRGLGARVLDRETAAIGPHLGAVYQPRALACLSVLGVYDPIRSQAAPIERILLHRAGRAEPAAVLEYADAGPPFPHALGAAHGAVAATFFETFAKYSAVRVDQGVEMLSLYRERGRVAGAVARDPQGDVTYRARIVIVTTDRGGAPIRAEVGAAARLRPYGEEHASLALARPDGFGPEVRSWLGAGMSVTAYPIASGILRVEAIAQGGILSAAKADGAEALRRILGRAAPPLEEALKALASTAEVQIGTPVQARVASWVGNHVALTGPAAHAMSPAGLNIETQALIDAAELAEVLSRCSFTGDFSRFALRPYETRRRPLVEGIVRLAHDLHRAGVARHGFYARAREAALDRLPRSAGLRRKLVRTLAGFDDDPPTRADRLRLAGILPLAL